MNAVLEAYGKMIAADDKFRRKKVDEAMASRDAGRLEEYVRKHSKKCNH